MVILGQATAQNIVSEMETLDILRALVIAAGLATNDDEK